MQESFGARLRRRREEQNIALGTIAEQTKIKQSLLEALERDDVSHWPSGIFRRAFIRAYAHAIGLNPDDVVREFIEVHPEPADLLAAAAATASAAENERVQSAPQTRLRTIVDSAIGSLSRLRRGPGGEGTPGAEPAPLDLPESDELDIPATPQASEPPALTEPENAVVAAWTSLGEPVPGPDLSAVARLCTEFARVDNAAQIKPLLERAAGILDASGLIVWVWDDIAEELTPALVHGYSDKVLAQLPTVRRDADNPTAAAFRSGETRAVDGSDHTSCALVLPLLAPGGCAGVLAIELQPGVELTDGLRAVATILAALLALLVGGARPAERPHAELPPSRVPGTHDAPSSYHSAALTR